MNVRNAELPDLHRIRHLYMDVYHGRYPLDIITDIQSTKEALANPTVSWLVAAFGDDIVGSVIFQMDASQRIGRVFGAAVDEKFRGHKLTRQMMAMGIDAILGKSSDVMYATTRTILPVPQRLTEQHGFTKLGIFPNVRKVDWYETHCLAAKFSAHALNIRKGPPRLHPDLVGIYNLVREQMGLEEARVEPIERNATASRPVSFEVIQAPRFVEKRYHDLERRKELVPAFYPFEVPNLLLVSKDGENEVFLYHSVPDRHCAVIAEKMEPGMDYTSLLHGIIKPIDDLGIRYIEILLNAYEPELQARMLDAGFLPSAYIPALRLEHGARFDCLVFTRTFGMLDFYNVQLEGVYKAFLVEYFKLWKKYYFDIALKNYGASG